MDQGPRYVLRNRSQVLKGILLIIFGAALVLITVFDEVAGSLVPPGMAALGLAGIAASIFLMPRVILRPDGVETHNWIFRVWVPWNHYRELDTKFGMYIVSSDHKDVVASYPGAGGLSKGREELGAKHKLGKSAPNSPGLPLHTDGTVVHWADMSQAIGLIENVYEHEYVEGKRSKRHKPAPGTRASRGGLGEAFGQATGGASGQATRGASGEVPGGPSEDPSRQDEFGPRAGEGSAADWDAQPASAASGVGAAAFGHEFPTQRTKIVDVASAAAMIAGVGCLAVGIVLSMS
ncbi:MAG: hypothetical protein ACTHW1_03115 [Ancrocorticia sp.]|uniref:hypothetical protein n=1 Tax=Ancrocorticia sp. TaxID=2593684 RepID=UPI003F8F77CB